MWWRGSVGQAVRRVSGRACYSTRPQVLLMDEWLLAGDADFLDRAKARLEHVVTNAEILVIATHDPGIVRTWCTRAIRLEGGRITADGDVESVLG